MEERTGLRWGETALNRVLSAQVRMAVDRRLLLVQRPVVEDEGRHRLRQMLEPLLIEGSDIEVSEVDSDGSILADTLIFRWRPSVTKVEVMGHGQLDGVTLDFSGAPHGAPLVMEPSPLASALVEYDSPTVSTIPELVTLQRGGWDENGRHWIYA